MILLLSLDRNWFVIVYFLKIPQIRIVVSKNLKTHEESQKIHTQKYSKNEEIWIYFLKFEKRSWKYFLKISLVSIFLFFTEYWTSLKIASFEIHIYRSL